MLWHKQFIHFLWQGEMQFQCSEIVGAGQQGVGSAHYQVKCEMDLHCLLRQTVKCALSYNLCGMEDILNTPGTR